MNLPLIYRNRKSVAISGWEGGDRNDPPPPPRLSTPALVLIRLLVLRSKYHEPLYFVVHLLQQLIKNTERHTIYIVANQLDCNRTHYSPISHIEAFEDRLSLGRSEIIFAHDTRCVVLLGRLNCCGKALQHHVARVCLCGIFVGVQKLPNGFK